MCVFVAKIPFWFFNLRFLLTILMLLWDLQLFILKPNTLSENPNQKCICRLCFGLKHLWYLSKAPAFSMKDLRFSGHKRCCTRQYFMYLSLQCDRYLVHGSWKFWTHFCEFQHSVLTCGTAHERPIMQYFKALSFVYSSKIPLADAKVLCESTKSFTVVIVFNLNLMSRRNKFINSWNQAITSNCS